MKITKFLHSCLLIENQGKTVLIDPGNFTYEQNALDLSRISQLNYLLITHSHPDHCYSLLIKNVIQKFPHVKVISNREVQDLLEKEGITVSTTGNDIVKVTHTKHNKNFDGGVPQNTVFTLWNNFVDAGDTFKFSQNMDCIALPVQAAWGSTQEAVTAAIKASPMHVVPIHDWHWRDEVRKNFYRRLAAVFTANYIKFIPLETGWPVEL